MSISYTGLNIKHARELAQQHNCIIRIAKINEYHLCLDMDLRKNRDNVAVSFPYDPPTQPETHGWVSTGSPEDKMINEWFEKYKLYMDQVEEKGVVLDVINVG